MDRVGYESSQTLQISSEPQRPHYLNYTENASWTWECENRHMFVAECAVHKLGAHFWGISHINQETYQIVGDAK